MVINKLELGMITGFYRGAGEKRDEKTNQKHLQFT